MIREASITDAEALLLVANQHELSVDPTFEAYPLSEVRHWLQGQGEPGKTLVWDEGGIRAACFIHPDTPRKRVEIDLFSIADLAVTRKLFEHSIAYAIDNYSGFEIRSACNKLDQELLSVFETSGLIFYRDYYKLQLDEISAQFPALPQGVEIRSVDLHSGGELLHSLESQSFSGHFGYQAIAASDWITQRLKDPTADHQGSFIAFVDSEPAGFLLSSDFRADVNGGWVDKLGVLEQFRGRGLGKLLLLWGAAHAAQKGYQNLGLGADTGNDSGALELYFNLGFRPQLSWRAYYRPATS